MYQENEINYSKRPYYSASQGQVITKQAAEHQHETRHYKPS